MDTEARKQQLRLDVMRTAHQEPVASNPLLTLQASQRLARPDSDFEPSSLPPATAAHVAENAELWEMRILSPAGSPIGDAIVQFEADHITAVHDIRIRDPRLGFGSLVIGSILASNENPVRLIGINAQSREFWQKMGVDTAVLDPYNNTTLHWSDYVNTRLNQTTPSQTQRQPSEIRSDLRAGGEESRERSGQAAAIEGDPGSLGDEALTNDELAFLDDFTKGFTDSPEIYYQLGGRRSRTANLLALDAARQFLEDGHDPEAIRQKTGWHQGVDKQWRYEISDHDASVAHDLFTHRDNGTSDYTGPLSEVYEHEQLFAAYPHMQNIDVECFINPQRDETLASLTRARPGPEGWKPMRLIAHAPSVEKLHEAMAHELQHAIQATEGFARGGHQDSLRDAALMALGNRLDRLYEREYAIRDQAMLSERDVSEIVAIEGEKALLQEVSTAVNLGERDSIIQQAYLRLAGEKEAMLTEQRLPLTPQQREATAPVLSEIEGDSIVIFAQDAPEKYVPEFDLAPKAQVTFLPKRSLVTLTQAADHSSFFHEMAHVFLKMEQQSARNNPITPYQQDILNYLGANSFDTLTVDQHERFAEGFEQFLADGPSKDAPSGIFGTVKGWLSSLGQKLKDWGTPLSPAAHSIYDRLVTPEAPDDQQTKQAEQQEKSLAEQLVKTGLYTNHDARVAAAVVGRYALAKAERDPNTPSVNAVFDQMNLSVDVAESIDRTEQPAFDFETFSLAKLNQQTPEFQAEQQRWLSQIDYTDPGLSLVAARELETAAGHQR